MSDVVERLSGADVAVVNKVLVTDSLLSAVPTLGLVSVTATGVNNVDLDACKEHGVAVTTKSGNPEHLRQDLELFDWSLTDAEMARADASTTPSGHPSFMCSS